MGIFDFLKPKAKEIVSDVEDKPDNTDAKSNVTFDIGGGWYGGNRVPIVTEEWNGEKTPGELGAVVINIPQYRELRLRAYDAYTKTDIVKIISDKFFQWVVGSGLKLESEPNEKVLNLEKVNFNKKEFTESAEARFNVFANSKYADYSRQKNLHELALDFFSGAFLGGDTLVICRIENEGLSVQFVSGEHVKTPIMHDIINDKKEGNEIVHGIEINARGEHIAYYVETRKKDNLLHEFERIEAKGKKTGIRMAWMIYGQKLSPDHMRGVPEISQVLEKVNKLDRYTEAAVSKAEQAANILYAIEHQEYSTGEGFVDTVLKKKINKDADVVFDGYAIGDGLGNKIQQTTSNTTVNMPPGASLKSFGTNIESNFEQFYRAIFNSVCASVGVPPEVALQMYNSNYSASRAAINGWGYIIDLVRKRLSNSFYKPVYEIWLYVEVLKNKIEAPGFIKAAMDNDFIITESYSQCRFTGKNMPHIDPLKEIKAIREMLGDDRTPLISREQGTEMINGGSWTDNIAKNEKEKELITEEKPEEDAANIGIIDTE